MTPRAFAEVLGRPPTLAWRAPGRVNLIGEHTDYNGGFVLPAAIPYGVTATVAARADDLVRVASAQFPGPPAVVRLADPEPGTVPGGAAYAVGVVREMRRRGLPVAGVDIHLDGDVPQGAGLSSSAALACAVTGALDALWGLGLPVPALVDVARRAENDFVGVPCGAMDQSAALLSRAGHLLFLDTRDMTFRHIPFAPERFGLELLVIDTRAPHRLVDGAYARRRRECAEACRALGIASLRDLATDDLPAALAGLDDRIAARVRHVVTENARVLATVALLTEGADPRRVGPLLDAAHRSLRDDYEVSGTELDTAAAAAVAAGAYGARMIGGGFGGSVLALVDAARRPQIAEAVRTAAARTGLPEPRCLTVTAAPGAGPVPPEGRRG
ncbi:galactokinase [Yinghuangia sp. ASG 101]|uniref:galactokinase n=1 Tax=Yinghuangia sp. ASG 101 TaxID=2896848 RepID=UPI001E3A2345|nr:galactokinase [Yinghuangia sp. ASG 101]UGQ10850.1 galactokinase [Yinghuangia sp. ASG 101]